MEHYIKILFVVSLIILPGCMKSHNTQTKLTLSAASSLAPALSEVAKHFTKKTSIEIKINYASSGTLAMQIEQGAPVDIFISASKKYIQRLERKGFINQTSVIPLYKNKMALVTAHKKNSISQLSDLKKNSIEKIAIGEPSTVPAGHYAKETLKSLNLWNQLKAKMIYAKNAEQVMTYVASGNVDVGLGYLSDARDQDGLKLITTINPRYHSPIIYLGCITDATKSQKAAKQFFSFLQSDQTKSVMEKSGFRIMKGQAVQ